MCILLNVKKHEKTFALNVDIFKLKKLWKKFLTNAKHFDRINKLSQDRELKTEFKK